MAEERCKIGLMFYGSYSTWAGGIIYIINIVNALMRLEDNKKPYLYIYHSKSAPTEDLEIIGYPYIKFFEIPEHISVIKKSINYLVVRLFNFSILFKEIPNYVYPFSRIVPVGKIKNYWIPDFQSYYLPHFFSEAEVESRKQFNTKISKKRSNRVVFSSQDAASDFMKFHSKFRCKTYVLNFASTLPSFSQLPKEVILKKYNLDGKYFMVPNQLWQHKNQITVLKAVKILKDRGISVKVIFSGAKEDHRNKDYYTKLQDFVSDNAISDNVSFVGFIDRREQLMLMNNALAIIQPSLFEGWSTVVEDTKALNQYIILSNLRVHKEQICDNVVFFNPHDATYLADMMLECYIKNPQINFLNYDKNILKFAEDFLLMFEKKNGSIKVAQICS